MSVDVLPFLRVVMAMLKIAHPLGMGRYCTTNVQCSSHVPLQQIVWSSVVAKEHTGEVDVENLWKEVDLVMVKGAAMAKSRPVKTHPIDANKIAPWIPPASRNSTVFNTEMQKGESMHCIRTKYLYVSHMQYVQARAVPTDLLW